MSRFGNRVTSAFKIPLLGKVRVLRMPRPLEGMPRDAEAGRCAGKWYVLIVGCERAAGDGHEVSSGGGGGGSRV